MQSWRPGTKKQYETYLKQWLEFCNQRQITYHSPSMRDALGFLMALHNKGLSYSTIGTARSALSNVIVSGECENFGTHSLVSRFMKSVFLQNKPLPKYDCTWDVAVVLKYLETLYPHSTKEPYTQAGHDYPSSQRSARTDGALNGSEFDGNDRQYLSFSYYRAYKDKQARSVSTNYSNQAVS